MVVYNYTHDEVSGHPNQTCTHRVPCLNVQAFGNVIRIKDKEVDSNERNLKAAVPSGKVNRSRHMGYYFKVNQNNKKTEVFLPDHEEHRCIENQAEDIEIEHWCYSALPE
jgi:hypothetical protein